ncbi:MAG TPA: hypothetical protein VIU85_01980, partial [Chthoniobacterales bacterium]
MKRWSRFGFVLCAVGLSLLCFVGQPIAIAQDDENAVRPTGVPAHRTSKSKPKQSAVYEDAEATATPKRARRAVKHRASSDDDAVPIQTVPSSIPKTNASSVI